MSDRMETCFADLKLRGSKAVIASFYIGNPSLDESLELAAAAAEAGADMLEIAIPFNEPFADSPILFRAERRAIATGATLGRYFDAAAKLRRYVDVPVMLFSHYNPVFVMSEERFVSSAAAAGIDAILVGDLLPEDAGALRCAATASAIALIPFIARTSTLARQDIIRRAMEEARNAPKGFVYFDAVNEVAGNTPVAFPPVSDQAESMRKTFGLPVVVGVGIDCAARAREAAGPGGHGADGVVVGSAIAKQIEQGATAAARLTGVRHVLDGLRSALMTR